MVFPELKLKSYKKLNSPINDSLVVYDEIIDTPDIASIDSNDKKAKHKNDYRIFQTTLFPTILLLINVISCHYCIKY